MKSKNDTISLFQTVSNYHEIRAEEDRMNRDEIVLAVDRLRSRLMEIVKNIRDRAIGDEYHIQGVELLDLEGIADALLILSNETAAREE